MSANQNDWESLKAITTEEELIAQRKDGREVKGRFSSLPAHTPERQLLRSMKGKGPMTLQWRTAIHTLWQEVIYGLRRSRVGFVPAAMFAMLTAFFLLPVFAQTGDTVAASLPDVVGHWEGAITREGKDWKVWLDLRTEAGAFKGTADLPDYGLYVLPVTVKFEGNKVRIGHLLRSSLVSFAGELSGARITGEWKGMGVTASFKLQRTQPQPRAGYVQEEVRFQNGEAMLAGTLIRPDKPGRHPAVVFTHGSGNQTRSESFYRSRAYLFARHGIAALIYDLRGKGASKGGGENANWLNLADDALAGVRYLQSRPEINPQLIGVSGFSQGGWVSPLAAARAPVVAFVLVGSAPGITPDAQNDYNVESLLRSQKVPAETVAAVMTLRQRVSQYQHTGKGDVAALTAEINRWRNEAWFKNALLPDKPEPYDSESKAYISFDPAPVWEKVKAPVLSLWGAEDLVVPANQSRAIIESALKRGGNQDYTLKIFPNAGHGLSVTREPQAAWDWPRLASGYQETMVEWVLKRSPVRR